MMTRIFWDTIFLISGTFSISVVLNGSLFTFGAGPGNSTIIEASISIATNSTAALNTSASSSATTSSRSTTTTTIATTTTNVPPIKSSHFTFGAGPSNSTIIEASISIDTNSTAALNTSTRSTTTTIIANTTTNIPPVKKFVAAAVRSHFDDCPDSHRHFCFHGTCRFLILEETPACVCHPGFVGMRCEHADLLAVVATNHRQQTVATVLVLCVIGCVLIMVLCTLLHCWWRQDCRRRSHTHHYVPEKHGASCCPSESGKDDRALHLQVKHVIQIAGISENDVVYFKWFEKTSCWNMRCLHHAVFSFPHLSGLQTLRVTAKVIFTCSDQADLARGKEALSSMWPAGCGKCSMTVTRNVFASLFDSVEVHAELQQSV